MELCFQYSNIYAYKNHFTLNSNLLTLFFDFIITIKK